MGRGQPCGAFPLKEEEQVRQVCNVFPSLESLECGHGQRFVSAESSTRKG